MPYIMPFSVGWDSLSVTITPWWNLDQSRARTQLIVSLVLQIKNEAAINEEYIWDIDVPVGWYDAPAPVPARKMTWTEMAGDNTHLSMGLIRHQLRSICQ